MIAIVGRDPGIYGPREQRILEDCINEAGIFAEDIEFFDILDEKPIANIFKLHGREKVGNAVARLHSQLRKRSLTVIVALGNEAAHALVPEWPDTMVPGEGLEHRGNIFGARDIENRRGYVFDSTFDIPVIVTVHPTKVSSSWVPWRMLLSYDLQRAKELHDEPLCRPAREVEIITSARDARNAVKHLLRAKRLASDIETWRDTSLACIGFAGESGRAFVFPAQFVDYAGELLRSREIGTIWANGTYDLFCLKHREGLEVNNSLDDVMAMWHAAYPELAGKKEDKKKMKMTRKSLAFLASMCTWDYYWKGDYETEEEFFIYNGRDCCVTWDVDAWARGVLDTVGAWDVYEHTMGLVWPVVDMLERGLRVDEDLRVERLEKLEDRFGELDDSLEALALPLLEREKDKIDISLFEEVDPTCECCGHGVKKQRRCWGCAGFEKAPSKKDFVNIYPYLSEFSKERIEQESLYPCKVCNGKPRQTRITFNANSPHQVKILLYDVLKLPKKFGKNTKGKRVLTSDEKALRGILGGIA